MRLALDFHTHHLLDTLAESCRWSWFISCNRFDSYWRWYNDVAVLSLFCCGSGLRSTGGYLTYYGIRTVP